MAHTQAEHQASNIQDGNTQSVTGQSQQTDEAQQASQADQTTQLKGSATPRTGLASLANDDFTVMQAIGGPRGIVESILPGLVFVVLFVVTHNVLITVAVSAILAVLQLIARLIQRQSVMGALTGLLAVGICLVWAWLSHDARNYYVPGFIVNAFWIVVLSISLIARIPGLGVLVQWVSHPVTEHFSAWLHDWRDDKPLWRAYMQTTVLWVAVFALRLAVQVPAYLMGSVGWLGTLRLIMGVPLFALAVWVSWLVIATPLHNHKASAHKELSCN